MAAYKGGMQEGGSKAHERVPQAAARSLKYSVLLSLSLTLASARWKLKLKGSRDMGVQRTPLQPKVNSKNYEMCISELTFASAASCIVGHTADGCRGMGEVQSTPVPSKSAERCAPVYSLSLLTAGSCSAVGLWWKGSSAGGGEKKSPKAHLH